MSLAAFQREFHAELRREVPATRLGQQPGMAVHRSTMLRAAINALEANFPAVACLVGQAWFRSAAAAFFAEHPACDARLLAYGAGFPEFLASAPAAVDLPYLADVARLDRLWLESYAAADAPSLGVSAIRDLNPNELGELAVVPHPATKWLSSAFPVVAIWEASRAGAPVAEGMAWVPQAAFVTRPAMDVSMALVDLPTLAFLDACEGGTTLAACAEHVLHLYPTARTDLVFARLLTTGALAAL